MPSLKEVKSRINSVKNIRKITSAMQMVSSAKLHQAQTALGYMLPYEERLHLMLAAFLKEEKYREDHGLPKNEKHLAQSPFISERPLQHLAVVAVASDSGLCGSYNANIIKELYRLLDDYKDLPPENITIYVVGKKMLQAAQTTGCQVSTQFLNLDEHPDYASCATLSRRLGIHFLRGKIDKVELLFYHFQNMAVQQIERTTFLPFQCEDFSEDNPSFGRELRGKQGVIIPKQHYDERVGSDYFCGYIVEPSRQELMDDLLPKVMRFRIYRAMLDACASEHAARTMAMKIATDNANDLIDSLTVQYNKSRQQAITNELLDIVGGWAQE